MYSIPGRDLVLASGSVARRKMMEAAMIRFSVATSPVDEEELRAAGRKEGASGLEMATVLAETKAGRAGMGRPEALVIGSDQLLECDGRWLGKPEDTDQAAENLRFLSGKTHRLITVAVVFEAGKRIWHHAESPSVSVRGLTDAEIDDYLDDLGGLALATPGVYQIEDRGSWILSRLEGCAYSILGMPLLQLLAFLREHGLTREGPAA